MPAPHPPEFRQRAVELAREREKSIRAIAEDLGISESCLRNWMHQTDVDEGARDGLTSSERENRREQVQVIADQTLDPLAAHKGP